MSKLFAVKLDTGDGPDTITFVEAADAITAQQRVLGKIHEIGMDAVTPDDLSITPLGHMPTEVFYLHNDGTYEVVVNDD